MLHCMTLCCTIAKSCQIMLDYSMCRSIPFQPAPLIVSYIILDGSTNLLLHCIMLYYVLLSYAMLN